MFKCATMIAVLALPALSAAGGEPAKLDKLPEGNTGIAAKYPGDKGIEKDSAVIFADDFEGCSSAADLKKKWDALTHEANLSIANESADKTIGKKSLLITMPKQNEPLASGADKPLKETHDVLFLRWYEKFDSGWLVKAGSVHNGAGISSKYHDNGRATPGVPADGRNKFMAAFECANDSGPSPGHLNVYLYWPEQGDKWGDHIFPSGTVIPNSYSRSGAATFGKQFTARKDFTPQLDRWYCYESMVKVNTPGKRDGRLAMWVDGNLVADFPNMRLRDVDTLKVDRIGIGVYIAANTERENRVWYDDVVAATSYIGPVAKENAKKSGTYAGPKDKLHVYLLIGQSNMEGRAQIGEDEKAPIPGCWLLNDKDAWGPAANPLNLYSTVRYDFQSQRLNPGYTFAKAMRKSDESVSIGLVVNARGGTSIAEWKKGGKLYDEAVRRAKKAQETGTLKGVLWHQGEADEKDAQYLDKLKVFIADLRKDLDDKDLPFVAGQLYDIKLINDQIAKLPGEVPFTGYAATDGLKAMEDGRHFDAPSTRLLGERYAEAMAKLLKK
jgi:hypothetical protein